jgi:hypothetical protein
MAQPITLHSSYAGMAQDVSRDQLPASTVWNMVDFFPNALGAPLRKRGGWVYASSAISAATFIKGIFVGKTGNAISSEIIVTDSITATSAGAGVWRVSEADGSLTFVGSVTSASAAAAVGAMNVYDPFLFGRKIVIPIGYDNSYPNGVSAASYARATIYDGSSTLSKIDVTGITSNFPYGARYAAQYKNRMILANTPDNPRRLFFNKAGKGPDNFQDPDAWLDMGFEPTGLLGLPTALLVFANDRVQRIRGSTAPPTTDFVVEDLASIGMDDYRSLVSWQGRALWCNTQGVYMSDAINVTELTKSAGLSVYWRALFSGYDPATWRIRGSVYRNYYFITIRNSSAIGGAFVDCLVLDLSTKAFFRMSNFNFESMQVGSGAVSFGGMWGSMRTTNRLIRMTEVFTPVASNKADADSTAIQPYVEYPCRRGFFKQQRRYLPAQGLTHFRRLYLSYDLRDAGSDDPTLTVSYVTTPEATSYTAMARTLGETTDFTRDGRSFGVSGERGGKKALALGVKVAQTGNSSDTRIFTLEAEQEAQEGSRLT